MAVLVQVESFEEEWRTHTRRVQGGMHGHRVSYGRACLWLRLACGHCAQRMVKLAKDGTCVAPKRAGCDQCGARCVTVRAKEG